MCMICVQLIKQEGEQGCGQGEGWLNRVNQSEEHELFSDVADNFVGGDLEDVEMDGFGEGSAFSNDGDISDFDVEGG